MDGIDTSPQGAASKLWTEARLARLIGLWNARLSAARIAQALGPEFTRSAVVGKLMRLGLRRSDEERHEAQVAGARRSRIPRRDALADLASSPPIPPVVRLPPPTPCAVAPQMLDILDLRRSSCRWPYPSGDAVKFCGHRAKADSAYCPEHHAIAYFAVLPPLTLEVLVESTAPGRRKRLDGQIR